MNRSYEGTGGSFTSDFGRDLGPKYSLKRPVIFDRETFEYGHGKWTIPFRSRKISPLRLKGMKSSYTTYIYESYDLTQTN